MNDKVKVSSEWKPEAVIKRLRQKISPGRPSAVQVFFNDKVPASHLAEKAKEIVDHACASLNLPPDAIKLGKVFRSARSFSVSTDVPDALDVIAKRDEVKTILESEQSDILPKPRNVKDAP